jgi:hypothetical protein
MRRIWSSEPAALEPSCPNEQRNADYEQNDRAEISEEQRKSEYYENPARQVPENDLCARHVGEVPDHRPS